MKDMMKKFAVLLCACVISVSASTGTCLAKEDSQDVPVTYSPSEDALARFNMQVIIIGGGSVFDGTQELTQSTNVYELKYKDQKIFKVAPQEGYYLKSIIYDGNDITDLINIDSTILITAMDHDTILTFTYEKKIVEEEQPPKEDEKNHPAVENKRSESIKTGDISNVSKMMAVTLLSGSIVFLILWKRKKDEEEEEQ